MKRGQLSLFIIIGLLLLLGALIAIAVFTDVLEYRPPEEQVVSELETELKPLTFAIQECQERLVDEAAKTLLYNGGYLDAQAAGAFAAPPPAGTGIQLYENQVIPYWHHVQSGTQKSLRPPLTGPSGSVQQQLEGYVDERIEECVSWSDFPQYDITRQEPTSTITFSNDQTRIDTAWDVQVNTSIGTKRYESFETSINAPVQRLYKTAKETIEVLAASQLPEARTVEWLNMYAGLEGIPPTSEGLTLTGDPQVYAINDVRPKIDQIITRTLSYFQLYGSRNATLQFREQEVFNQIQINSLIPATTSTSTQTTFNAYNPSTVQTYLSINDNVGAAVPEIKTLGPLSWFGITSLVDNSFYYDITYPIVFEYRQDGYTLNVGYEANIKDNEPMNASESLTTSDQQSACANPGGTNATITTNRPGVEATLVYTCGSLSCPVGTVRDGRTQTTLPACASGELEAYADGYFSEAVTVRSTAGEQRSIRLDLYEPQQMNVNLLGRRVYLREQGTQLGETTIPVDARLFFVRQGHPYVGFAEQGSVELVPGTYDVYALNLEEYPEDDPFIIPEDTREAGGEEYTLEQLNLTTIPTVYLELTGERAVNIPPGTTNLTITATHINPDAMREHEDLKLMGAVADYGTTIDPEDAFRAR